MSEWPTFSLLMKARSSEACTACPTKSLDSSLRAPLVDHALKLSTSW